MWGIGAGLGLPRRVPGSFSLASPGSPSYEAAKSVTVRLEETPIFTGFHPTLPVHAVTVQGKRLFFNGFDRPKRYDGENVREAFALAPVRPPTVSTSIADFGSFSSPSGCCVDDDGNLYVVDSGNHRIVKMSAITGKVSAEIGSEGSGNDQFQDPAGICCDDTHLYVADYGNDRVKKHLLSDLSYVAKHGTTGSGNDQYDGPMGIAFDGTNLFVADSQNDRIKELNTSLVFQSHYGTTGTGTDNFDTPAGVFADSGKIAVMDSQNFRFIVTDKMHGGTDWVEAGSAGQGDGEFHVPIGITGDGDHFYIADAGNARLQKWDDNGAASAPTFVSIDGELGDGENQYTLPYYLTMNKGILYVPEIGFNHRVQKVTTGFLFLEFFGTDLEADSVGTRAYGYLYVDEDGNPTAYSPVTEGQHGTSISATVGGHHSTDPKIAKIWVLASLFDVTDDLYFHSELDNDPNDADGLWSISDTTEDDDLGDLPYLTDKREGVHGLPPVCRVATIWRDTLWMAGAVSVPDYTVGSATIEAAWDSKKGLWKVHTPTDAYWTEAMVGRTLIEKDDEEKKGLIVEVDETNQIIWLCTEWEGTTGAGVDIIIRDERDESAVFFSTAGIHEDIPATQFVPINVGDGDEVLQLYPKGERLWVFTKHTAGVITGTSPENYRYRRVSKAAGIQSPSSVMEFAVEGGGTLLAFWRYPRIWVLASDSDEPVPFSTFIDPLLEDVGEGPSTRAVTFREEVGRVTYFAMGSDSDMANGSVYTFEDVSKTWSREPGPRVMAAGTFQNEHGRPVSFYLDEWGVLWQPNIGDSEGAYSDALSGAVESFDEQTLKITNNTVTFSTDLVGVPCFLVNAAGTYERNIIIGSGAHYIQLAWQPSSIPDDTFSVVVGGIECILETGKISRAPEYRQKFKNIWIDHDETQATVLLECARNEEGFERVKEMDWSGRSPRPVALSGPNHSFAGYGCRFRLSSVVPANEWSLRGYIVRVGYREEKMK